MIKISNKEELRKLIARYVNGNSSRQEIIFLEKYYDHFEDQSNGMDVLTEDELELLKKQMFHNIRHELKSPNHPNLRRSWIYKVAVVLLFLITAGAIFWSINKTDENLNENILLAPTTVVMVDSAHSIEKHIYLPDGSYVVLKPESQLRYPQQFGNEKREVMLNGEAYFDIQHDSLRPFLVKTEEVTTRVLGTAFTISSYDQGAEFSISVTRGRVEVSDQTHQLGVLQKDDQLILDKVTQEIITKKLKEEERVELEPEKFIMDDMTVEDAIKILQQRWKCDFLIDNPALRKCRFTTSFSPKDKLEDIVAVISSVIGSEYSITNKVVSLSGEGCQ